MLGGRARVSEILTKKRGLSLEMIRRFHRELQVPLESLVGAAALGGRRHRRRGPP